MASAANSGATLDETLVPTPGAARCARTRVCGACRRPGEGAAARLAGHRHARRAGVRRRSVVPGADGDLRAALRVGLPRVVAEALAAHRCGAAGDHRRREDLDHPDEAGHPLLRRPGLRRQAARAHRRRLRLLVQAVDGPERAARRRPDRHGPPDRRTRGGRRGAHVGQVRLRQADRRAPRARSLHVAAQADRGELPERVRHPELRAGVGARGGGGGGTRYQDPGRGHRPLSSQGVEARLPHRARGQSQLSRGILPGERRSQARGARAQHEGQADPADRHRRDRHHGRGPAAAPAVRAWRSRRRRPARRGGEPDARRRQAQARVRRARDGPACVRRSRSRSCSTSTWRTR